jgi:hypothetical protein
MLIPVEARESCDVEPGRYRAKCIDVRDKEIPTRKGPVKGQRIVWEIDVPGNDNVQYLVGKNYEATLAKNSLLRNDLISWFGHDIKVRQFDTATLKGKEAIITVQDIENEGRANPYHWVARVEPLVDEDAEDAEDARSISPNVVCG